MMEGVTRKIVFGGEPILFTVQKTARRKTVAISIGHDGVRVLAPNDMGEDAIRGVIRAKAPWVLRKQASFAELGGQATPREFVSGEAFQYLGRAYRLKVRRYKRTSQPTVAARGASFVAQVPAALDKEAGTLAVRQCLTDWYRRHAGLHAPMRAARLASSLGVPAPTIRVVDQSKRWGSCDARGTIRLNWRVIMAPMSLVDYVIAHEVCHLIEHNHSRRFWRSLETIMPDFEDRVRALDRLGPSLVW